LAKEALTLIESFSSKYTALSFETITKVAPAGTNILNAILNSFDPLNKLTVPEAAAVPLMLESVIELTLYNELLEAGLDTNVE
jgi:hypothetical protein